jgi:hypothetical protein
MVSESAAVNTGYFPGDSMDSLKTLALAAEYEQASIALRKLARRGEFQSFAPFRLAALHALELYFVSFLRMHGVANTEIRSTGHQFCAKMELAARYGFSVRKRTCDHLAQLTGNREYLVTRYDTTMLPLLTQVNRLEATLKEVGANVTLIVHARAAAAQAN